MKVQLEGFDKALMFTTTGESHILLPTEGPGPEWDFREGFEEGYGLVLEYPSSRLVLAPHGTDIVVRPDNGLGEVVLRVPHPRLGNLVLHRAQQLALGLCTADEALAPVSPMAVPLMRVADELENNASNRVVTINLYDMTLFLHSDKGTVSSSETYSQDPYSIRGYGGPYRGLSAIEVLDMVAVDTRDAFVGVNIAPEADRFNATVHLTLGAKPTVSASDEEQKRHWERLLG